MQRRTAREVVDITAAVEPELVDHVQRFVLDDIEIGVVTVARYDVAVLAIPFGVFHAHVLGRRYIDHLTGGSALHMNLEDHLSKEQYRHLLRVAAAEGCNYFTFNTRFM